MSDIEWFELDILENKLQDSSHQREIYYDLAQPFFYEIHQRLCQDNSIKTN